MERTYSINALGGLKHRDYQGTLEGVKVRWTRKALMALEVNPGLPGWNWRRVKAVTEACAVDEAKAVGNKLVTILGGPHDFSQQGDTTVSDNMHMTINFPPGRGWQSKYDRKTAHVYLDVSTADGTLTAVGATYSSGGGWGGTRKASLGGGSTGTRGARKGASERGLTPSTSTSTPPLAEI